MRWRVLFTKIPGPVLYEINSSHKTSLGALCEAGGHEWGVKYMRGMTRWERGGRAVGAVVLGEKIESQTDTQREIHTEKMRQRSTHKKSV